nr:hypothetical protein CFP56_09635 [Quercus suber]
MIVQVRKELLVEHVARDQKKMMFVAGHTAQLPSVTAARPGTQHAGPMRPRISVKVVTFFGEICSASSAGMVLAPADKAKVCRAIIKVCWLLRILHMECGLMSVQSSVFSQIGVASVPKTYGYEMDILVFLSVKKKSEVTQSPRSKFRRAMTVSAYTFRITICTSPQPLRWNA